MKNHIVIGPQGAYLLFNPNDHIQASKGRILLSSTQQRLESLVDASSKEIAAKIGAQAFLFTYDKTGLASQTLTPNRVSEEFPKYGWDIERFSSTERALQRYAQLLQQNGSSQVAAFSTSGVCVGRSSEPSRFAFFSNKPREQSFLALMSSYAHAVLQGEQTPQQWQKVIEKETALSYTLLDNVEARFHHKRSIYRLHSVVNERPSKELAQERLEKRWKRQGYASVLSVVNMQAFDSTHEEGVVFRREVAAAIKKCYKVEANAYRHLPLVEVRVPYADAPHIADSLNGHRITAKGLESLIAAEIETAYWLPQPNQTRLPLAFEDLLWNLEMVQAPKAWEKTKGKGIVVAVVDTGIDYRHNELKGRFGPTKGKNCYDEQKDPMDDNGHGTHVAGSIAGQKVGVAPEASLYAVKVLDADGSGSTQTVLMGLDWCLQEEVNIVNMSLGSTVSSPAFAHAVKVMFEKGICVIASAGNSGDSVPHYPSSYPGVMSIAAIDQHKQRASFSTMNPENDFSGPGVAIYSSIPGNGYAVYNGTSMSSPHVSGVCALLLGAKNMHASKVEELLKKSALPLGIPGDADRRAKYGFGLVQAYNALMEVIEDGPRFERKLITARNRLYHILRPKV